MIRTLGVLALLAFCIVLVANGGRIGPLDLTDVPAGLFASAAATALILVGIRAI